MRFHEQGSKTETLVHSVGRTRTYRAPELDEVLSHNIRISQKYDVWSLGCVFLELISCHLVGCKATRGDEIHGKPERHFEDDDGQRYETFDTTRVVEDFTVGKGFEDKYFVSRGETREVKKSVINVSVTTPWLGVVPNRANRFVQWISYLRGLEHCSKALSDFLELIQNHMLVIDPVKRWSSKKVLRQLDEILNQKAHPNDYYSPGRSRRAFQPSPLLRPWDDSYDRDLWHKLNDQTERLAYSVDVDISALSDGMKHDFDFIGAEFLPQCPNSVHHTSPPPPSITSGDVPAREDERRTISDECSSAHGHSSRDFSGS